MLRLERLSSGYGSSPVLHEVSLEVKRGEIVALIGANGAGKSTLLNTVMGLVPGWSPPAAARSFSKARKLPGWARRPSCGAGSPRCRSGASCSAP
jgi:ABC-type multidrug transport system ATPase subunit